MCCNYARICEASKKVAWSDHGQVQLQVSSAAGAAFTL
jgi:hypothetical protein